MSWITRGSALEVFNTASGERRAAFCFGAAIKEPNASISAVAEYHIADLIQNDGGCPAYRTDSMLLVGVSTAHNNSGMLCLFDIKTSSVIKAIDLPHTVSEKFIKFMSFYMPAQSFVNTNSIQDGKYSAKLVFHL